MNNLLKTTALVLCFFSIVNLFANENKEKEIETKNTAKKTLPYKVLVMDFTTIDMKANEKYKLPKRDLKKANEKQNTLTDNDRKSISSFMQGVVKSIDALTNNKSQERAEKREDDEWDRELSENSRKREVYDRIAKSEAKVSIIGSEYLAAYLGNNKDVFSCISQQDLARLISQDKNQKADSLIKKLGVDLLVFCTVGDLATRKRTSKSYDIETTVNNYTLNLLVTVVDAKTYTTVYANVYSASIREIISPNSNVVNNSIFQKIMEDALRKCAKDLAEKLKNK